MAIELGFIMSEKGKTPSPTLPDFGGGGGENQTTIHETIEQQPTGENVLPLAVDDDVGIDERSDWVQRTDSIIGTGSGRV